MQIRQIICTTRGAHFCDYPTACHRLLTPGLGHFIQPIGSTSSGHSCNIGNDVPQNTQDRGKLATEGHKKLTGTLGIHRTAHACPPYLI